MSVKLGLTVEQLLQDIATKGDIPKVPTKLTDLDNDAGYITAAGSITGTATKAEQDGNGNIIADTYLPKTIYEYNEEVTLLSGQSLCIGTFPCNSSNITISISSVSRTLQNFVYNGTLVIATQSASQSDSNIFGCVATMYGDDTDTLTDKMFIKHDSNYVEVYFSPLPFPTAFNRCLVHIQALGLYGNPSQICQVVSEVPSEANDRPKNALKDKYLPRTEIQSILDSKKYALLYNEIVDESIVYNSSTGLFTLQKDGFSRTPVVNDNFLMLYYRTANSISETFIGIFKVTQIASTEVTAQQQTTQLITGNDGPQGIPGGPGDQGPQGTRGMAVMRCSQNLASSATTVSKSTLSGEAANYETLYVGEQIIDNTGNVFVVQSTTTSDTISVAYKYTMKGEPNERLKENDTRSANQTPQWYLNNYGKSIITEFKQCNTIGVNSILSGTYCNLTTITPWGNNTGGLPVQFATNSSTNGRVAYRVSNGEATGWTAWEILGGVASTKDVVTTIDASTNIPTSGAVKTFVEGKGYATISQIPTIPAKLPNPQILEFGESGKSYDGNTKQKISINDLVSDATQACSGLMSAADKTKLDELPVYTLTGTSVRIWGLAPGIYTWESTGGKSLFYKGETDTSSITMSNSSGLITLIINATISTSATYLNWIVFDNTNVGRIFKHGWTSQSGGSYSSFTLPTTSGTVLTTSSVKNNLTTSTSSTSYALSAYQGYVLNNKITALESGGKTIDSITVERLS